MSDLQRFTDAQKTTYQTALAEIKNGRKMTHWMWYIFPQIKGLGLSETARFYSINDFAEAKNYLAHPVLGKRLIEISEALLEVENKTANQIFGSPDDVKLKSSMTLFGALSETNPVFQKVLDRYFDGAQDERTWRLIDEN